MDLIEDLKRQAGSGPEHVLVVEDDAIIAMDLKSEILAAGIASVEIAMGDTQALDAIGRRRPHFAFLDVRLGGDFSFPVADALSELRVSYAFATGCGDLADIPDKYAQVPYLTKPFEVEQLRSLLVPKT